MNVQSSSKGALVQTGRRGSSVAKLAGWKGWLILVLCATVSGICAWAAVVRYQAPKGNTDLAHFDAVIVLGALVYEGGIPSPALQARVNEGVREYKHGVAPRLILSGGPERKPNSSVEADIMAQLAEAQGVPDSAIIEEPRATDTIQNGCYTLKIMQNHGWHSAEVVSSASHLPRVGIIFDQLPIQWRMHVAPPVKRSSFLGTARNAMVETLKTARYLLWAKRTESCEP